MAFFSVIIPVTDKSAYLLPITLASIHAQSIDSYEVILIDGTKSGKIGPLRAESGNRFAMMNQGLEVAKGEYIHFLNPGEFYISNHVFSFVEKFVKDYAYPDISYSGCQIRHYFTAPQVYLKQITIKDLKGANVPPSLQSFWFRKTSMEKLSEDYEMQGGFDLICRSYRAKALRKTFMRRILTDYEYRKPSSRDALQQFWETIEIIFSNFGLSLDLFSYVVQNCGRFMRWWRKMLKTAFWKQHVAM